MQSQFLDQRLLYGSRFQRFIREMLTNSSIFWFFDLVHKVSSDGWLNYWTSPSHWVLLAAGIAQAWVISRNNQRVHWWQNLIAPGIYTLVDVILEGAANFFAEPYHFLYWAWALAMTLAYLVERYSKEVSMVARSLLLVVLLPATYMLAEWNVAIHSFTIYWLEPAHQFILLGTLVLGIALGVTNIMRERFERLLYSLATHVEQIASWTFDTTLIEKAYDADSALALQRVERTLLFMDVRGFTPWSEAHSPQEVVKMINQFYQTAEPLIQAHNGFKIQMMGDEIMTRFYTPDDALQAALALQQAVARCLQPYGLSIGIGLHVGDVIEGLVGSQQTRQYGIFGDVVNTAARLQGQAQANEIVISEATWQQLKPELQGVTITARELALKGKAEPLRVKVITPSLKP